MKITELRVKWGTMRSVIQDLWRWICLAFSRSIHLEFEILVCMMWTRAMFSWQQINLTLSLRKSLRIWYASHLISTKMTCVSHIDTDTLRSAQSKMVYNSSRNSKGRESVSNAELCTVLAKLVPGTFFLSFSMTTSKICWVLQLLLVMHDDSMSLFVVASCTWWESVLIFFPQKMTRWSW